MFPKTALHPPQTASLDRPLYYLDNMEMVLGWVLEHHADLLTPEETTRLTSFLELPVAARALLTRMIMRTGEMFRTDRLRYPELPVSEAQALGQLIDGQWLEATPEFDLDTLFRLFTLAELRPVFRDALRDQGIVGQPGKAVMKEMLQEQFPDTRTVTVWLGPAAPAVVRLPFMELFDRIRLMFFGNLRQSWSDFVLVELGLQRYEPVPFSADSRAFHSRLEVDTYLQMHHCRQQLDEGVAAREVWQQLPDAPDNAWLAARRDRLLLELGRKAERAGDRELALHAYSESRHREARLKQLRLLERMKRFEDAWQILRPAMNQLRSDSELIGLSRLQQRIAKKLSVPVKAEPGIPLAESRVSIANPDQLPVELAVAQHLRQDRAPVYYVENTLFNALFGLLFWNVIFRPLPGAFFHPFQSGPADLTREDFVSRRASAVRALFDTLRDGRYRDIITDTWHEKDGVSNPFVAWPVLSGSLIQMALDCIPAAHLDSIFRRLLIDLREHRSGFPDLIRFIPDAADPGQRYQLIEVKGPGDRLQDHQHCWLTFFREQGVSAEVCHVRWAARENSG